MVLSPSLFLLGVGGAARLVRVGALLMMGRGCLRGVGSWFTGKLNFEEADEWEASFWGLLF